MKTLKMETLKYVTVCNRHTGKEYYESRKKAGELSMIERNIESLLEQKYRDTKNHAGDSKS